MRTASLSLSSCHEWRSLPLVLLLTEYLSISRNYSQQNKAPHLLNISPFTGLELLLFRDSTSTASRVLFEKEPVISLVKCLVLLYLIEGPEQQLSLYSFLCDVRLTYNVSRFNLITLSSTIQNKLSIKHKTFHTFLRVVCIGTISHTLKLVIYLSLQPHKYRIYMSICVSIDLCLQQYAVKVLLLIIYLCH